MAEPNWSNQTIWTGDNLDVMRGMNGASADLIYLDPPFNSKANYAAPIGSQAAGAAFKDTWGLDDISLAWHGEILHENPGLYDLLNATRKIHGDSMMSYLIYMAIRIMEMRRILKPTGSLYLHCDQTASHYLKLLLDAIFGSGNFLNEVVWAYRTGGVSKRWFGRKHDSILFYQGGQEKRIFNLMKERSYSTNAPPGFAGIEKYKDELGRWYTLSTMRDVWEINAVGRSSRERTGYPTQKPLALLRRIIEASSNKDDMVLDPFCGCATTCVAAQELGRQWIGIDISPKAAELIKDRMHKELGMFFGGAHRTDIPKRTDLGKLRRYNDPENKKFLYGEQGGYCNGCETHFEIQHFQVDHIIPRSKGGTDHVSNLQLLCGSCNSLKGTESQEALLVRLTDKGWIKRRKENHGAQ